MLPPKLDYDAGDGLNHPRLFTTSAEDMHLAGMA